MREVADMYGQCSIGLDIWHHCSPCMATNVALSEVLSSQCLVCSGVSNHSRRQCTERGT